MYRKERQLPRILTLDMSKWVCGVDARDREECNPQTSLGKGGTYLLNGDGYMCCLGQFSRQAGVFKRELKDESEPGEFSRLVVPLNKPDDPEENDCIFSNTSLSDSAIRINDDDETTVPKKVELLRRLFNKKDFRIDVENVPERFAENGDQLVQGLFVFLDSRAVALVVGQPLQNVQHVLGNAAYCQQLDAQAINGLNLNGKFVDGGAGGFGARPA